MSSGPASARHLRAGSLGPIKKGQEEKPAYINDLERPRA